MARPPIRFCKAHNLPKIEKHGPKQNYWVCPPCITESVRKYNHSENGKFQKRKYLHRLRNDVLSHYSGGQPKCACCGENKVEFLALDHIYGKGFKHRQELKAKGTNAYLWVRKNGFPEGFRILCHNCNMSFGVYGYCPHIKLTTQ